MQALWGHLCCRTELWLRCMSAASGAQTRRRMNGGDDAPSWMTNNGVGPAMDIGAILKTDDDEEWMMMECSETNNMPGTDSEPTEPTIETSLSTGQGIKGSSTKAMQVTPPQAFRRLPAPSRKR